MGMPFIDEVSSSIRLIYRLKREGLTGDNWNWLDGSDVNESVTKWTDSRAAFGDLAAALILTYSPVFITSMLMSTKVPSVCELKNTILSDVTCSEGWTKLDTRCYLFVPVQKTWLNGRKFCNDMNSEIVSISSPAIYETLQKHLVHTYSNLKRWWLGLSWNESQTPSNWKWLDGSDLDTSITPWTDPSQSAWLGQMAGLAEMTSNNLFLRTESMTSLEHFICQRPLDQETTTMTPVAATTEATTSSGKITLDTNIISVTTGTRETATALTTTTSVTTCKSETTSTRVTNTTRQAESTTKLETNTSNITTTLLMSTTPETDISNITTTPVTTTYVMTITPEITTTPMTTKRTITTSPTSTSTKRPGVYLNYNPSLNILIYNVYNNHTSNNQPSILNHSDDIFTWFPSFICLSLFSLVLSPAEKSLRGSRYMATKNLTETINSVADYMEYLVQYGFKVSENITKHIVDIFSVFRNRTSDSDFFVDNTTFNQLVTLADIVTISMQDDLTDTPDQDYETTNSIVTSLESVVYALSNQTKDFVSIKNTVGVKLGTITQDIRIPEVNQSASKPFDNWIRNSKNGIFLPKDALEDLTDMSRYTIIVIKRGEHNATDYSQMNRSSIMSKPKIVSDVIAVSVGHSVTLKSPVTLTFGISNVTQIIWAITPIPLTSLVQGVKSGLE
uniref:C-type lectin domain-containing protein n=1 Tax=Biomphalaria glabrata TaxID=6526 RepID=A0A2C9KDH5_BIOGL